MNTQLIALLVHVVLCLSSRILWVGGQSAGKVSYVFVLGVGELGLEECSPWYKFYVSG